MTLWQKLWNKRAKKQPEWVLMKPLNKPIFTADDLDARDNRIVEILDRSNLTSDEITELLELLRWET